jgi:hypothetical protein
MENYPMKSIDQQVKDQEKNGNPGNNPDQGRLNNDRQQEVPKHPDADGKKYRSNDHGHKVILVGAEYPVQDGGNNTFPIIRTHFTSLSFRVGTLMCLLLLTLYTLGMPKPELASPGRYLLLALEIKTIAFPWLTLSLPLYLAFRCGWLKPNAAFYETMANRLFTICATIRMVCVLVALAWQIPEIPLVDPDPFVLLPSWDRIAFLLAATGSFAAVADMCATAQHLYAREMSPNRTARPSPLAKAE